MNNIKIDIKPKPQSRPRFAKGRAYELKEMTDWKTTVSYLVRSVMNSNSWTVMKDVPVKLNIVFYLDPPKRIKNIKKLQEYLKSESIRVYKKPDIDNLAKAVMDSINKILFYDDGLVSDLSCQKYYSYKPRIEIYFEELEEIDYEKHKEK